MVLVKDVVKSFGEVRAVNGISFEVAKGTCFGLLGPNGAGKSTAISMIVGTLKPDSGSVTIAGHVLSGDTDPARQKIGYVPQELALFEDLSSLQNLGFFGSLYNMSKPEIARKSAEVLAIVGLSDRATEPVKNFSGGMKRRLNIAIALVQGPELLVLDEPTVGVDPQSRNAIFDVLEKLKAQGMTLIYTSHYMEEVERMCDHILIVDHGKAIISGTLEQLLDTLDSRFRIRFEFLDEDTAVKAEAALNAKTLGKVFRKDSAVEVLPSKNAQAIVDSISYLQGANVMFEDMRVERGSLEEVFLASTGRSLRD